MRTTIDLPDELFRRAKARAALKGMTLKELITRFVQLGLRSAAEADGTPHDQRRSTPPIVRAATGQPLETFTHAELHRLLDEE